MAEPTSTSFIPKRNPAKKENRPGRRKVYVGTILIRILFIAAIAAAVGVYLYESRLKSNLDNEIFQLNNAISTFKEEDMAKVLAFDNRLNEVKYRVDRAASIVALLQAVEDSTVDTAQITLLNVERTGDESFTLAADLTTPSFDIALFQRQILEDTDTLVVSKVSGLNLQNVPPSDPLFRVGDNVPEEITVSFKASLNVDIDKVPYTVLNPEPVTIDPEPVSDTEVTNEADNQETLGAVLEEEVKPNAI